MTVGWKAGLLLALLSAGSARAADAPVAFVTRPAVAGIASLPRLAHATDAGAKRINAALDRLNTGLTQAIAQCRAEAGAQFYWSRTVTIAMAGPDYISLLADDSNNCGGAYPNSSRLALVYDLRTGAPASWERLLPRALVDKAALDQALDGSAIGTIQSATLYALYLASLRMDDAALQEQCRPVLAESVLPMMLWPDAKAGGIALQPAGLPHVTQACAAPAILPVAQLRALGVDTRMLDAIDSAHQHP